MAFTGRNCTGVLAPAYLSFFTASVSFLLFLVTSAGNLLVCLAVYKDPKRKLRTPFNFFVVNLACADLVVGLIVEPISVAVHLREGVAGGRLGDGVPILHMSYFISCTASVSSLAALTIDRYIAITSPFYYRTHINVNKMVAASLVIWAIAASLPFVYFKVGLISYSFVFANTAVILTLGILIVSYARLLRHIRHQIHLQVISEVGGSFKAHESEMRATKAFLLVLVAFLFCYTPSCVLIYIMSFCTTCSCYSIHWFRDLQFLFIVLNSCLNPFIYAWRLSTFRSAFALITRLSPRVSQLSSQPTPPTNRAIVFLCQSRVTFPFEDYPPLPPVARHSLILQDDAEPKGTLGEANKELYFNTRL